MIEPWNKKSTEDRIIHWKENQLWTRIKHSSNLDHWNWDWSEFEPSDKKPGITNGYTNHAIRSKSCDKNYDFCGWKPIGKYAYAWSWKASLFT
jgi:hypothetical protein